MRIDSPGCGRRLGSARGAVLVHVAVAIIGLLAFSALSIDYGVMWMARRQAQNAADAAALAGATSLAFDNTSDFDKARAAAELFGEANAIFGVTPNITRGAGNSDDITQDISFPDCPPSAPGVPDTCVRVNVYRTSNTLSGGPKDPLPTFFAPLFGRTQQGVRATATAQILTGNATDCLKPWAVVDKWEERWPEPVVPWNVDSVYDRWDKVGRNWTENPADTGITNPDVYIPPTTGSPGTGFQPFDSNGQPTADYGRVLRLTEAQPGGNYDQISPGFFLKLDFPTGNYRDNIAGCVGTTFGIGDQIPVQTGGMVGMTQQGTYVSHGNQTNSLVERDPTAAWDPATKTITNSCAPGLCTVDDGTSRYMTYSPRIVPVATFNIDAYLRSNPTGSTGAVTVTNIFGFFVLTQAQAQALGGAGTGDVWGVLVSVPGLTRGSSTVPVSASYLRQIILVQ